MSEKTAYVAKKPDDNGIIHYTTQENDMWSRLMAIQSPLVKTHMCDAYNDGLEKLALPDDRIPQCCEVSAALKSETGWTVAPVPALIGFGRFFRMLSEKTFPAASFIRRPEEIGYLQEPDIFHEIYGHTPLLVHPIFADFTQMIGEAGLEARPEDHVWLARLYWMSIEFGLIQTTNGLKAYGAGLASSHDELPYALDSTIPLRKPFDILDALRTPYRIDIMQPIYFVLENFEQLLSFTPAVILKHVHEAQRLGLYAPTYKADKVH